MVGVLPDDDDDDDVSEAEEEAEQMYHSAIKGTCPVPSSQIRVYRATPQRAQAVVYANVLWLLSWLVDDAICNNGWRMSGSERATWAKFSLTVLKFLCTCPAIHTDKHRGSDAVERLQLVRPQLYADYQAYLSQILTQMATNVSVKSRLQCLSLVDVQFLPMALDKVVDELYKATQDTLDELQDTARDLVDAIVADNDKWQLMQKVIPSCEGQTRTYLGSAGEKVKMLYLVVDGCLVAIRGTATVTLELVRGPHTDKVLSTAVSPSIEPQGGTTIVFRGRVAEHEMESSRIADGLQETVLDLELTCAVTLERQYSFLDVRKLGLIEFVLS
ncbi:hypothetical protein QFC24_001564 [Naganishia onofrii]|uniref:Uncharacterized protein n=1 Tax=Naganishia onofrii TaxID=1851511 RepID=A0ACC2XU39_9TREE|nr:hypothetical protein QFC24_001564 [Naganishia onofrii]